MENSSTHRELKSRADLHADGWTDRKIDAALDEADEYGPSGHGRNTTGVPYYDASRVAVAAYRVGLSTTKPPGDKLIFWQFSLQPTSFPIATIDFHRLAEVCLPGSRHEFYSLRLSHPVGGRRPGTRKKEADLIKRVLQAMLNVADGGGHEASINITAQLAARARDASQRLGQSWSHDVCLRPALRQSYVSRASSTRAISCALDILSMMHVGVLKTPTKDAEPLVDLLIKWPVLRFDQILQPSCSQLQAQNSS
jgi:hypothetical protein